MSSLIMRSPQEADDIKNAGEDFLKHHLKLTQISIRLLGYNVVA